MKAALPTERILILHAKSWNQKEFLAEWFTNDKAILVSSPLGLRGLTAKPCSDVIAAFGAHSMADLIQGSGRGGRDGGEFTFTALLAPACLNFTQNTAQRSLIDEMLAGLRDAKICRNFSFGSYLLDGSGTSPCICTHHGPACTCPEQAGALCDVCLRAVDEAEANNRADCLVAEIFDVASLKKALPPQQGRYCWICFFVGNSTDKHPTYLHSTCKKCRRESCSGCTMARYDVKQLGLLLPAGYCHYCGLRFCRPIEGKPECFSESAKRAWCPEALTSFLLQLFHGRLADYSAWRETLGQAKSSLPVALSTDCLEPRFHGFLMSTSLTLETTIQDQVINFQSLCAHYIAWRARSATHTPFWEQNPAKRQKLGSVIEGEN